MAGKKNKKSRAGSPNRKPNAGQGKQVSKGSGTGTVQQSPPIGPKINLSSKFAIKNDGTAGDITATGSEIVGIANSAGNGAMTFVLDMNPTTWAATRVSRMIPLFETYKIMDLTVTYIPSCSTSTGGLIYLYYDRDPNDPPISNVSDPSNLARLMSNQNAAAGQVWKPLSMRYRPSPSDSNGYYAAPVTDSGDLRLTSQGIVYGYTSAGPVTINGGLFKVDYVIKMRTPTGVTGVKSSLGGFTYQTSLNSPAATTPGQPYAPAFSFSYTQNTIIQFMLEYALTVIVDGAVRVLDPYTPLYVRYFATTNSFRTWLALGESLANSTAFLVGHTSGGQVVGNGWWRTLTNLFGAGLREQT